MAVCSLAIAAGVLGAVALVKRFVFRRRFGGGYGPWAMASCGPGFAAYGGRCGHDDDGGRWVGRRGWPGFGGRGRGYGPGASFWLRALFARLDTTPGQEREIRASIEDFQRTAMDLKGGLRGTRDDVARAVGGEVFDDGAIAEAGARADATAAQLKEAFSGALRRIHAVLDAKQRERLADLLAKGPGFGRGGPGAPGGWGGPYRETL